MKYLLDSNICIYLIKEKPSYVIQKLIEHDPIEIGLPTIVIYELYYGAYKSQRSAENIKALEKFIMPFQKVAFDDMAAKKTGELRAILEKRGSSIGPYDLEIAGIALAYQLVLITNNLREFKRVPELKLENWITPVH